MAEILVTYFDGGNVGRVPGMAGFPGKREPEK